MQYLALRLRACYQSRVCLTPGGVLSILSVLFHHGCGQPANGVLVAKFLSGAAKTASCLGGNMHAIDPPIHHTNDNRKPDAMALGRACPGALRHGERELDGARVGEGML